MAGPPSLTSRKSSRYNDIAEFAWLFGGKRQHVGYPVFTSVTVIQRTHAGVRDDGHRHLAAGAGGRDRLKPAGKAGCASRPRSHHMDGKRGRTGRSVP